MTRSKFWLIIFLYSIPFGFVLGQNQYKFSQLKQSDGLAHNNIFELYRDRENYIWIGAGSKLQRYDGTQFITFEHEPGNPESLAFGDIRAILEDSKGRIWVGTDGGGLSRFIDGRVETFKNDGRPGSITSDNIEHLLEMPDGSIYIATWGGGINRFHNGEFTAITHSTTDTNTINNNNVVDILYDPDTERLWVGSWEGGLCYIQNGKVYRFSEGPGGYNSKRARCIEKTADGSIWIGSWGDGLFRYKNDKFEQYTAETGDIENNNILTLSASGDQLWIGTWGGGVTQFAEEKFTTFRHQINYTNTISSDYVESSLIDQYGNLWIGTFGGGITIFEEKQFESFDDIIGNHDLSSKFVKSIIEDQQGQMWIAGVFGIYVSENNVFQPATTVFPQIPHFGAINKLHCTKSGEIWIGGSTGIGLYTFDGTHLIDRSVWSNINFKDYFIQDIYESSDGSIWISADVDAGLCQIKNDSVKRYFSDPSDTNSLTSNDTYATIETADGTIWIASSRYGLNALQNGKITRYQANELDSGAISNNYIYSFLRTSDNDLWIATEFGLNKYDFKTHTFRKFFKEDGLLDNTVLSLLEDDENQIWIGTHKGISKLDPKTYTFQNFDNRSGIDGAPFYRSAILQNTQSRKIYVGGVNGMISFHPDVIKQREESTNIKITNVLVNNASIFFDNYHIKKENFYRNTPILLESFQGSISFEFSDMNYGTSESSLHEYCIVPLEDNWNKAGTNFTAVYSSIPAGDYQFQVRSSFDGINWSKPATLKFSISPRWFEILWVQLLIGIALAGVIPLLVTLRFRYLELKQRKLKALINEKTAEITHKNEQIEQKSVALEKSNLALKNALFKLREMEDQRIVFQENDRQAISRELHDSISTTLFGIRMMLKKGKSSDQSDKKIITVPEEVDHILGQVIRDSQIIINNLSTSFSKHTSFYDSLNDLVARSRDVSHAIITLGWEGNEQIEDLKLASNLFRIIQEALSNSLKHAEAENITIVVKNQAHFYFEISDDGIGFNPGESDYLSQGLQNMQKRATEIKGDLRIISAPGNGTFISLQII